jgi:hypothetical protein
MADFTLLDFLARPRQWALELIHKYSVMKLGTAVNSGQVRQYWYNHIFGYRFPARLLTPKYSGFNLGISALFMPYYYRTNSVYFTKNFFLPLTLSLQRL